MAEQVRTKSITSNSSAVSTASGNIVSALASEDHRAARKAANKRASLQVDTGTPDTPIPEAAPSPILDSADARHPAREPLLSDSQGSPERAWYACCVRRNGDGQSERLADPEAGLKPGASPRNELPVRRPGPRHATEFASRRKQLAHAGTSGTVEIRPMTTSGASGRFKSYSGGVHDSRARTALPPASEPAGLMIRQRAPNTVAETPAGGGQCKQLCHRWTVGLFASVSEAFRFAYSQSSHVTLEKEDDMVTVIDYEPFKLSTMRICSACKGSILLNLVILAEQVILYSIFGIIVVPHYMFFSESRAEAVLKQEAMMTSFATILQGLAGFLLSFYTALAVNRWWVMRTQGIAFIRAAAMDLQMYIVHFVCDDEEVLEGIRRYAAASVALLFLWRRGQLPAGEKHREKRREQLLDQLVDKHELLSEEEVDQLMTWDHLWHETVWSWITGIVGMLYEEGKIHSDQLLSLLLQECAKGRMAAQLIQTHLTVKIPFQYVHLLGFLVKLNNVIQAVIAGILFGPKAHAGQDISCVLLIMKLTMLPLLFNAILLINAELSDPFDGGLSDFPKERYIKAVLVDGAKIVHAGQAAPPWIITRRTRPDAAYANIRVTSPDSPFRSPGPSSRAFAPHNVVAPHDVLAPTVGPPQLDSAQLPSPPAVSLQHSRSS